MKILWFLFLFSSLVYPKEVTCLVPNNIKKTILPLFSKTISYTKLKVIVQGLPVENIVNRLTQVKNSQFAIVRRDVLWQVQQDKESNQKEAYITIAELPYKAQLFLLQNAESFDTDIDMLEGKTISIGVLENKNADYLKKLLDFYGLTYRVLYKSMSYKRSIKGLKEGTIDAYFTFLPKDLNIDNVHSQTLFSKDMITYFESLGIFEIAYNGIFSPYVLVASSVTTDEEIENIIYRLMEKNIFSPMTDTRFGTINQYVITHLESVKTVLQAKPIHKQNESTARYANGVCRKYHYGFLKLLRQKPKLKKKLKRIYNIKQRKIIMKQINKVLVEIDAHKLECNLQYLESKKQQFFRIQSSIKI